VKAQNVPVEVSLGKCANLVAQFSAKTTSSHMRGGKPSVALKVSSSKQFNGLVNYAKSEGGGSYAVGQLENVPTGTFYVNVTPTTISGHIVIMDTKKAYQYHADDHGNAFVEEVDINKILCIDYTPLPTKQKQSINAQAAVNSPAIFTLESLPGAAGCIYLDFDGETVSGTPWKGGATIVAAPANMTDELIRETWELVSEDYRPFNMNVTTNRAVFNSYPKNRRMMHISTTSKDVTTTGVAYIGSFNWNDDTPCWGTYTDRGKICGEVAAHEVGHTLDLGHDGRISPAEGYYGGAGNWAPIMGVSYYNAITTWSKGEYTSANNLQDDIAVIASTKFGVGYRNDDVGNATTSAKALVVAANGSVSAAQNAGLIERTADLDFFSFNTGGGNVTLNVNTVSRHGDLDILVRLYTQAGAQIGSFNPDGLNASVTASLGAGIYYISIDGTGFGTVNNGYSDYASLGSYFISGTIPPPVTVTLRTPENPTNTVAGLDYKYYEGTWNALPDFTALTAVKTGNTALVDLAARNRDDLFGFSFTGYVNVPTDGSYTFYTSSDDGSRLYIGSTLVVDNDGLHGTAEKSGTIGLKAGKHAVTVVFFEQGGDQVLSASYSGPGIGKQTIPASALYRIAPATNQAPIVSITSPANNASFTAPASITINASASDADGSVSKVEFYNGITLLNSDATAPYAFAWTNVGVGTYSITAKATDNSGDVKTSSVVTVVVNTATNQLPTVSITSPANNANFNAPASFTINATASDVDGSISKVEFYNGTTLLNSDATSPYAFAWTNVLAGTYSLTARATDNSGAVKTSSVVTVVVANVTTDACSALAQYVENGGYAAGSNVKNSGSRYECKPWPFSGWCNAAAWAYAPGTGAYWQDAWVLIGTCQAQASNAGQAATSTTTAQVNEMMLNNVPNPFISTTNIDIAVAQAGLVSVKLYDKTGQMIMLLVDAYLNAGSHSFILDGASLPSDVYIVRYESSTQVITRKIVKAQ